MKNAGIRTYVTWAPACLGLSLAVAGCGLPVKPVSESSYHLPPDNTAQGVQGQIFGAGGLPVMGLVYTSHVNPYLWRGALDTLSQTPILVADSIGGVIATDWYASPAAPGERQKVTVYISGRRLQPDAVRVTVFRQVARGGQWTDAAPVGQADGTLKQRILTRAAALSAAS
jgi:hypothetical protein